MRLAVAFAAALVLERNGSRIALVMTDVSLAGTMDGVTLAHVAKRCDPTLEVIVTSGSPASFSSNAASMALMGGLASVTTAMPSPAMVSLRVDMTPT